MGVTKSFWGYVTYVTKKIPDIDRHSTTESFVDQWKNSINYNHQCLLYDTASSPVTHMIIKNITINWWGKLPNCPFCWERNQKSLWRRQSMICQMSHEPKNKMHFNYLFGKVLGCLVSYVWQAKKTWSVIPTEWYAKCLVSINFFPLLCTQPCVYT